MFQNYGFIFCLCWLMGIVIPKYISSSNNDNNKPQQDTKGVFLTKKFSKFSK